MKISGLIFYPKELKYYQQPCFEEQSLMFSKSIYEIPQYFQALYQNLYVWRLLNLVDLSNLSDVEYYIKSL